MFSEELSNLIIRVITSWQVIVVTVVLILYFMLVSYVSRLRHHSRPSAPGGPPKKAKNKGESPEAVVTEDDGLGLEEE